MMFFKLPFGTDHKMDHINARFEIPESHLYSEGLIEILEEMLAKNPERRPNVGEIFSKIENIEQKSRSSEF